MCVCVWGGGGGGGGGGLHVCVCMHGCVRVCVYMLSMCTFSPFCNTYHSTANLQGEMCQARSSVLHK